MSNNQPNASRNPYQGYALNPGQQYSAGQLWGTKSREISPPGTEGKFEDVVANKIKEREAFQFPYPKPSDDGMISFKPMQGPALVSHHDEHFTPLPDYFSAPAPNFPGSAPNFPGPSDNSVIRLLVGQLRKSVEQSVDCLNAIEALLNQQQNSV